MKILEKKNRKKGFTLVELLAVVVILGIVSVIGISSVSRLIDKAKEDQRVQQEKTVSMAAESYLQENSNARPKTIGEAKIIKLGDLKKANYLREDVKNADGESCMNDSFVRVYKYSKSKYTYSPYIYCGKEKAPAATTAPKPDIKIQYFYKDSSKNNVEHIDDEVVVNNVSKAKVRIIFTGGENTDGSSLLLDGYTYSISVKKKEDSSLQEVYNSGTLNAGYEKKLVIEKSLADYIDIADTTTFTVRAYARNTAGGYLDTSKALGEGSTSYNDKTPPTCSDVSGQAVGDDDWKKNAKDPRVITVKCNDGDGSQCLRENFSKTWPNEKESEAEYSWVMIEDNAGNKNVKDCQYGETGCCKVRVNVDGTAPTVEIEAYQRSSGGTTTGKNILKKNSTNTKGWEKSQTKYVAQGEDANYIIQAQDYTGTHNNWFNNKDFPNGVIYKVNAKDSIHLYRWEWSVNAPNTSENSTLGGGTEQVSGYFNLDNQTIYIYFKEDGYRHGQLRVYDRAGNVTKIDIKANLDKIAPNVPDLGTATGNTEQFKLYKTEKNGSQNQGIYTFGSWSKYYLKAVFDNSKIYDAINPNNLELSGASHYNYTFTNQDGTTTSNNTASSNIMMIKEEGTGSIKANACDKAGNCSPYSASKIVKIDTIKPQCQVTGGKEKWTNQNITVLAHCEENNGKYGSGCATADLTHEYKYEVDTTIAGAVDIGDGGKVYDNAGNETVCDANQTVKIDKTPPICTVEGGSKTWTNKSRTIVGKCDDDQNGNTHSGCLEPSISHTYETEMNVSTAGAVNIGDGGKVYDNAGNEKKCDANQYVKIDKTEPTCTVTGGDDTWINKNSQTQSRIITATCSDSGGSECKTPISFQEVYTTDINTTKAGAEGNNEGGTVYDNAGNFKKCSANQTVKIDKTPPACPKITPTVKPKDWTNTNIGFTFKFDKDTDNYKWYTRTHKTDGWSDWKNWGTKEKTELNQTISGEGKRKIAVETFDAAGNSSGKCGNDKDKVYYIDKTPPYTPYLNRNATKTLDGVTVKVNIYGDCDKDCYSIPGRKYSVDLQKAGDACYIGMACDGDSKSTGRVNCSYAKKYPCGFIKWGGLDNNSNAADVSGLKGNPKKLSEVDYNCVNSGDCGDHSVVWYQSEDNAGNKSARLRVDILNYHVYPASVLDKYYENKNHTWTLKSGKSRPAKYEESCLK